MVARFLLLFMLLVPARETAQPTYPTDEIHHMIVGIEAMVSYVIYMEGEQIAIVNSDADGFLFFSTPECMNECEYCILFEDVGVTDDPPVVLHDRVIIYNVIGQIIYSQEITREKFEQFEWNATTKTGRKVPSGVYFIRFGDLTRKVTVVK